MAVYTIVEELDWLGEFLYSSVSSEYPGKQKNWKGLYYSCTINS